VFVLRRGIYQVSKQEYSYGRRAQSTIRTLQWRDVAIIETDKLEEAIAESQAAIAQWKPQGFTADRWQVEGRGKNVMESAEVAIDPM